MNTQLAFHVAAAQIDEHRRSADRHRVVGPVAVRRPLLGVRLSARVARGRWTVRRLRAA